jgi:hypothetical protein
MTVAIQLDIDTYQKLSSRAGYRGLPGMLRTTLCELATSKQVTPSHLKNASLAVAADRAAKEKGGKGPAPKTTINMDGILKHTLDVLAKRAGIAPKGVMEAMAYICANLPQGGN